MSSILILQTTAYRGPDFIREDQVDILIDQGRIVAIDRGIRAPNAKQIDGRDFFVTPGFVNAHFHPSQQQNRALGVGLDHAKQMDLLHATSKIKDDEDKYWFSLLAIIEGLKCGTTCFYSVGSDIAAQVQCYQELGVRAACTMIPKDIEATEKNAPLRANVWATEERLRVAEELHQKYHGELIRIHFGACNVRYASDRLILGMQALAEKYNVGYHMHAAEGQSYVDSVLLRTGHRSVEHLHRIGALSPRVSLAHATKLTAEEIGYIAQSGTHIVHCPRANAYVAVGTCPVKELLDAGVNIALGSDAAINNNSNEVRGEAHAVFNNLAARYEQSDSVHYLTLFRMLTENGTRAIGIASDVGVIETGKKADVVLWSKNDIPFIPGHNYLADLIFADSCRAHTILVDGRIVFENYRPMFVNELEIIRRTREASERYHEIFRANVSEHLEDNSK